MGTEPRPPEALIKALIRFAAMQNVIDNHLMVRYDDAIDSPVVPDSQTIEPGRPFELTHIPTPRIIFQIQQSLEHSASSYVIEPVKLLLG